MDTVKGRISAVAVSGLALGAGVFAFVAPSLFGLSNSLNALGVVAIVFGAWVFVDHGQRRTTAAGVYCLAAGFFIGASCLYYRSVDPSPVSRIDLYHAAIWSYLSTVAMYLGWWSRSRRALVTNQSRLSSHMTAYARTVGFVMLVFGLVMHFSHVSNATLDGGATFDGSVILGSSFLFGDPNRRHPAWWRVAASMAALGVYVLTQFTGGGRLVLVSLGFAILFLVQDQLRFRHFKWAAIIIAVPTLIAFASVGRNRNPADPSEQQASGLSSVVTPLDNFATEIQEGLDNGGLKPLVGDITFPVPRAVWHSKPLAFGQTLASHLNPVIFAANPSNSAAALNQGEWYFIAGRGGVVIMIFFSGFVVAWLDRRMWRRHSRQLSTPKAFLGIVALSILAAGMPDLAWASTSTWSGRAIPRLLALTPFILVALVTPRRRTLTLKYTSIAEYAPRESKMPLLVTEPESDLTSVWGVTDEVAPPFPFADSPPGAQTSALASGRRGMATLSDQVFSSLQNYLILVFALRSLNLERLGAFSIAYTSMFVVVGIVRAFVFEPFTIRFTNASSESRRQAGRDATGVSLGVGIALGLICLAASFALSSGTAHYVLMAFGVALPVMLLQDAWRMFLFASGRAWAAATNDLFCLLATAPLVVVASVFLTLTPGELVGIWAAGTAVGALLGLAQTRVRPLFRGASRWLRHTKDLSFRLAGATVAISGLAAISYSMLALVVSVTAVGQLGASIAIMAPVTTFVSATVLFLLPEAARWHRDGRRKMIASSATMSIGLIVIVLVAAGIIDVLPGTLTHLLAGPNWQVAKHLLFPVAIWIASSAARQAPASALRALGQGPKVLSLSIVTGLTIMAAALGGGAISGAQGAAWGYAISETASIALWWTALVLTRWTSESSSGSVARMVRSHG